MGCQIAGTLAAVSPSRVEAASVWSSYLKDSTFMNGLLSLHKDNCPPPASRLAVLPATSHTALIGQVELLHAVIEPFLKGETPKGMFQ